MTSRLAGTMAEILAACKAAPTQVYGFTASSTARSRFSRASFFKDLVLDTTDVGIFWENKQSLLLAPATLITAYCCLQSYPDCLHKFALVLLRIVNYL